MRARGMAVVVAVTSLVTACGGDDTNGGAGGVSSSSATPTPVVSTGQDPTSASTTTAPATTARPSTTKATTTTSPPVSREAKLAVARCLDAGSTGSFLLAGFTEEAEAARDLCDEAATQLAIEPGAGADSARSTLLLWGVTLSAAIVRAATGEFDARKLQELNEAFYAMESKVEKALGL